MVYALKGTMSADDIKKTAFRTHRGLRERAIGGFSAGGKTYGYDSFAVDPDDPRSKKKLIINPAQAEIVRKIFERYADGESPRSIADDLNRQGIPSPGSYWNRTKRRAKGWTQSALVGTAKMFTGILRRELYVGQHVWNRRRSKKVPGTSKRVYEVRPESEWITTERPELRIIDDLTWCRVMARLKDARAKTHPNNLSRRRPPRYLLSGIMKCGECGSNFVMQDARAYGCSSFKNGGKHLCNNRLRVKREVAEAILLKNIKNQLLSNAVTNYVEKQFRAEVLKFDHHIDTQCIENEIADARKRIEKVLAAIETVGISYTLATRLRELEATKQDAEERLLAATVDQTPLAALPDMVPTLMERWRALVADMESLATNQNAPIGDIETARGHLHGLLGDVTLKPQDGVLWAHPALNAKGLTEVSPLHIKVVAGA